MMSQKGGGQLSGKHLVKGKELKQLVSDRVSDKERLF